MPTYLYECNTCEKQFEVDQRITEDPLTECDCGKGRVRRLIQPTAILFKGSGFHINDYAPKAGAASTGTSGSTSASTTSPATSDATGTSETPGGAGCSGNPTACAKCDAEGA